METEKMRGQMSKEKQIRRFMWMLLLLSCAIFFLNYDERVLPYNSTILAFSYKYGFILRYPKGKSDITGYKFEPWHYRYVGANISYKLREGNATLEEYLNIY